MAWGPQRHGAQCSCIGCIGLRPALSVLNRPDRHFCYLFTVYAFAVNIKFSQIYFDSEIATMFCSLYLDTVTTYNECAAEELTTFKVLLQKVSSLAKLFALLQYL